MSQLEAVSEKKTLVSSRGLELLDEIETVVFTLKEFLERPLKPEKKEDLQEIKNYAQQLGEKLSKDLPSFGLLINASQGSHHMEGTVLEHSVLVAFNVVRIASEILGWEKIISKDNRVSVLGKILVMAALFHDISKPWPEVQAREDRFLYHAEASADWVEQNKSILGLDGEHNHEAFSLLKFLVNWHMHPHVVNESLREKFNFVANFKKEIPEVLKPSSERDGILICLLLILNEADAASTYIEFNPYTGQFVQAPFNREQMWAQFGIKSLLDCAPHLDFRSLGI